MKRKLTSFAASVFAFLGFQALGSEVVDKEGKSLCAAESAEAVYSSFIAIDTTLSEICFVPFKQLTGNYSYVDVSAKSRLPILPDSSISLPIHQVKSKGFLKNERLLIAAEPYKRFELAKLCRELVQRGFQAPNIVIWTPDENSHPRSFYVSAEDFLVEVLNFGAVVVASSKHVADQLQRFGISAFYPDENLGLNALLDKAASQYSVNGYLPAFYVVDGAPEEVAVHRRTPVYTVIEGLQGIRAAFESSVVNAIKQDGNDFRGACAR